MLTQSLYSIFFSFLLFLISQKCWPNSMNLAQMLNDNLFKWKKIIFYWFIFAIISMIWFYHMFLSFLRGKLNTSSYCTVLVSSACILLSFTLLPISFNLREPLFYQHKHKQSSHYFQLFQDSSLSKSACLISPKSFSPKSF